MKFTAALALLFTTVALAQISDEPSGSNCDGTQYSQSDIDNAATAALNYYAGGETVGNDNYPHQYNDYEGFDFSCSSPYLEFPIEQGITYNGGSPGADRVVIGSISSDDSTAAYCAVITHDGQSNNDFAECTDN